MGAVRGGFPPHRRLFARAVLFLEFGNQRCEIGLVLQNIFQHAFQIFRTVSLGKQVAKLVAGRAGFICNTCAATAHRIMSEPGSDPSSSGAWSSRLFARIKRVLRHRGSWDLLSAG